MKIWHILAITILAAVALYGEWDPMVFPNGIWEFEKNRLTKVQEESIESTAEVVASTTTVVVRGQLYRIIEDDYITTSNGRLVHYQVLEPLK